MPEREERREELATAACDSRAHAYAPYSNFHVGAAVLAGSGRIYTGVNVENAAYGLTTCAERVAIFKAVAAGERSIRAVAVCTENGVAPCGSCRQVMREFADGPVAVYLLDARGYVRETTLDALLPDSFGPEDLEATQD